MIRISVSGSRFEFDLVTNDGDTLSATSLALARPRRLEFVGTRVQLWACDSTPRFFKSPDPKAD